MSGRLLLAAPICEAFSVCWLRCRWSALQWPGSCVINETQICCRGAFSLSHAEMPSPFCHASHSETVQYEQRGIRLHSWLFGNISMPVIDFSPCLIAHNALIKCPVASDITFYLLLRGVTEEYSCINHKLCTAPLNILTVLMLVQIKNALKGNSGLIFITVAIMTITHVNFELNAFIVRFRKRKLRQNKYSSVINIYYSLFHIKHEILQEESTAMSAALKGFKHSAALS